jgi:hypothetical protein
VGSRRLTGSRLLALLLAAVVLAAATGGALGALATGALDHRDFRSVSVPSSTAGAASGRTRASNRGGGVSSTGMTAPGGNPAASNPAAFYAGRALRGNGDGAIPLARAERLAALIPTGATVDRSAHTLRFASGDVSFVALASPRTTI